MEKELIDEIKNIVRGDVVSESSDLESHSTDYSVFKIRPQLIVYPKDSLDIQSLVFWVKNKKESGGYGDLSLTVRAAGTGMSGGSLNDSIIVDVARYMSGVLNVQKGDFGVQIGPTGHSYKIKGLTKVLPGTFYRDLEKETKESNLLMPCYPASKSICAVGGMVANNGAGEKTLKYGQNKDFVKELKVVLSDGKEYTVKPLSRNELEAKILQNDFEGDLYKNIWDLIQRNKEEVEKSKPKTSKNSSGYFLWDVWDEEKKVFDLTKLIVGAQGTTAIITEITYKLVEIEKYSELMVVFLKDLKLLPEIVSDVLKLDVETFEVYDDNTFKFAVRFMKDFLKDKGFKGVLSYLWNGIPELFMMLTGGVPKLIMMVEFVSSDQQGVRREVLEARDVVKKYKVKSRITRGGGDTEKYWNVRHDSFKLLKDHSKKLRTAPFIDDIVVPPSTLPQYIPQLINLLDGYELLYTIAGHVGNGNLHVIPLMDFEDPKTDLVIKEVSKKVYEMVKYYGGSMSAEHNDGLIRTPYLPMMFGPKMYSIFEETKEIFDERYMFNPMKKVGATEKDIEKYIIKPGEGYGEVG